MHYAAMEVWSTKSVCVIIMSVKIQVSRTIFITVLSQCCTCVCFTIHAKVSLSCWEIILLFFTAARTKWLQLLGSRVRRLHTKNEEVLQILIQRCVLMTAWQIGDQYNLSSLESSLSKGSRALDGDLHQLGEESGQSFLGGVAVV